MRKNPKTGKKKLRVFWSAAAEKSLETFCQYIRQDSPSAARKVKARLLAISRTLNDFPQKFAVEEELSKSSRQYRSVTVWHYKMIYEVKSDVIVIAYLIHTSQDIERLTKGL